MTARQLLEEMADLESRIAVIYERFAAQFRDASDGSDLWASMSLLAADQHNRLKSFMLSPE